MVKCDVKGSMDVVSGANKCDCLISRSDKYFESTSKVPLLHPQIGMLPIFDMINFRNGCTEFVIAIPKNGYMLLTRKRYDLQIVTKKSPK